MVAKVVRRLALWCLQWSFSRLGHDIGELPLVPDEGFRGRLERAASALRSHNRAEPEREEPDNDWRIVWFQHAHSDMRWAKEQGWRALQWTVILFVAIGASSQQLSGLEGWPFAIAAVFTTIIGLWYQQELHQFGKESRDKSESLVSEVKGQGTYLRRRDVDPNHLRLLLVRQFIVVAAFVFTLFVIFGWRECGQ